MLIRERIAIGVAVLFLGGMAYDAAFTEQTERPSQSGTVVTVIDKPPHRMPQEPVQEPVAPTPVPVDPCAGFEVCARSEAPGLESDPAGSISEEVDTALTHEIPDAMQQAEDGE